MPFRGAIGRETVSVAGTAVGLDTVPGSQNMTSQGALVTVETARIRFCIDGTTATTSVGHLASPGDVIELVDEGQVRLFSAIRADGVTASLEVTHFLNYIP